jgi:Holliday junction resolvasome RuvABC endonuclease subunit
MMGAEGAVVHVGINITSAGAYLGAVRCPDLVLAEDGADRILSNQELDLPARLEDFRARVAQELRRLQPARVGLARTLMFKNWTMKGATARFSFEAAAMLAAVQEGYPCELVRQEDAAKSVGVALKEASKQLPAALGIEKTPYWKERSVAFMVARHLAEEHC